MEKTVHVTHPDRGQLTGRRENPNLGEEVRVSPDGSGNPNLGDEIAIPSNRVRSRLGPTKQRSAAVERDSSFVSRRGDCPNRVNAFCSGPKYSYLFSGPKVYFIRDDRVVSSATITSTFPSGPDAVDAAVYDNERELLVLIRGRAVYAYKESGRNSFRLDSAFPKELPSTLFTPSAAIRWHDKHQMLLSNGGKFALYDEYWNKSLMSARTVEYFKGLPENIRGISNWENGRARIYTKNLVFIYDASLSSTVADGVPVSTFLKC
ncbi:hypothetical protein KIN20_019367 [Parelaphostrongylus tenuis]|uniref:Uncharacterized protein n=1 Tax=Parelaphostrongylus tenuis TaxID=148309 RepID=A0AAD5N4S4_PARTN|nr:hypothetical protein KIN20_019367 [Parelaphostrongylus tenuis]